MNEAELYKLAEKMDEDVLLTDFCTPETTEFDNEKFVEGAVSEHDKKCKSNGCNRENPQKNNRNLVKMQKSAQFKQQYFSYYDDVKTDSDIEW